MISQAVNRLPNLTDNVEKVADEVGRAVRSAFESLLSSPLFVLLSGRTGEFSAGVQRSLHVGRH